MTVELRPGDRLVDNSSEGRRGVVQVVHEDRVTVRWRRGNETDIRRSEVHDGPQATGYTLL